MSCRHLTSSHDCGLARRAIDSHQAVVTVGGATEPDMKERKDRVEDSLAATRAAASEGYVPGGGVSFLRSIDAVNSSRSKGRGDEKLGYDVVAAALTAPIWHIAHNSGVDGDVVAEKVSEGKQDFGYNAGTGQYEQLYKSGIIDPAKVVRAALVNAASVAGLMLTSDVAITDLEDEADPINDAVC